MNKAETLVEAVGATDVGRRSHNEDAYFVDAELGLMLVADGVGGHQAGEVASAITCATVAQEAAAGGNLDQGIRAANQAIMAAVHQGEGREGMASTAVAMLVDGANYEIAWVGDSRAYLWDGRLLKLLTRDHSLVENLLARGEITLEEARTHPQKNVIVQAIGLQAEDHLRVDINRGSLRPGEIILLCSDGMSDILDNATIVEILRGEDELQGRCESLVRTAIEQGGSDNSTVVMVQAPADLPLDTQFKPDVVWTYDPRSGEVTGLHEIAPHAPAAEPQVKKVKPRKPDTTQMMSVEELERELARVKSEPGADGAGSSPAWLRWLLLAAGLVVVGGGLAYGLGLVAAG